MIATGTVNRAYMNLLNGFDEAVGADGGISEGWAAFLRGLGNSSGKEREGWARDIRRDLREDGLTFTVSQDDRPVPRREDMDPVPWILSSTQWAVLERGIAQRARLLEAVARDLLGPRTLLRNRLVPPELVFSDPGYLRPCVGLSSNMGAFMFQYAVDLARGPDGRMRVLEDHAQAPSGAGYALESRTILGRVFPQWISNLRVRRLAPYFRQYRESLMRMYEGRRLEPRAVLMTPGPHSATYFEHAYLAAYLGYTLAQGSDLLVRDGSLRLKTLEGLQPVDILLRRVDADCMDPLELRRDGFHGVTGLLGAMRGGRAACVNHPGCGLLENRGLLPFYPALCRELLGEELETPSVATWWCGQPKERSHVLANLENLVVKPIQRRTGEAGVYGWECGPAELEALRGRILAHPRAYVGQERIGFSSVPTLVDGDLEPRPSVLRAFASASRDGYQVMPGALARSSRKANSQKVSMKSGGILKDVWVLGEAPESHHSLWLQNREERPSDWFTGVFTSRSAENLFWVGRYAERLARRIRLVRGMIQLEDAKPDPDTAPSPELIRMIELLETFCGHVPDPEEEGPNLTGRLLDCARGSPGGGGMRQNLHAMVVAAYNVRDIWSQDTWRLLISLESIGETCFADTAHPFARENDLGVLNEKLNAFHGLIACGMTRESGWSMLMLGRSIEAGIGLCELVEGLLLNIGKPELAYSLMEVALRLNENLITYRRHFRTTPQPRAVMRLTLTSEINPRSLVFHLGQVSEYLRQLPPPMRPEILDPSSLLIKQVRGKLLDTGWRRSDPRLFVPELLREARTSLEENSSAVSAAYFSHSAHRALEDY